MQYIFLSIIASIFVIIGYIPEITSILKTKHATIDNLYIWFIWSCGSIFSITFFILNEEYYAMSTYIILFIMNSATFLLKLYYYKKSNYLNQNVIEYNYNNETISPIQKKFINTNNIIV
jgi:hypothetical protein